MQGKVLYIKTCHHAPYVLLPGRSQGEQSYEIKGLYEKAIGAALPYASVQHNPAWFEKDLGGGRITAGVQGFSKKTTGPEMAEAEPGGDGRYCSEVLFGSLV